MIVIDFAAAKTEREQFIVGLAGLVHWNSDGNPDYKRPPAMDDVAAFVPELRYLIEKHPGLDYQATLDVMAGSLPESDRHAAAMKWAT